MPASRNPFFIRMAEQSESDDQFSAFSAFRSLTC